MKKERKPPKEPAYPLPPFKILHMERTGCYGICPIYTVCVDEYGDVRWDGRDFVKEEGKRLWAISEAKVKLLNDLLTRYDFLNLDKEGFPNFGVTCGDSCIITVVFKDGSRKKIDHYVPGDGKSPALNRLENRIDAILGVKEYVGRVYKS
jgi:hypothetical protein